MLGDQGRGRWVVRVALGSQSQRFGCWGDADRPRIGSVRKAATCLMQKSVLIKTIRKCSGRIPTESWNVHVLTRSKNFGARLFQFRSGAAELKTIRKNCTFQGASSLFTPQPAHMHTRPMSQCVAHKHEHSSRAPETPRT